MQQIKRLLSIEFHKLKHNRASKILILIYFGLLASIALITAVNFDFGTAKFSLAEQGIFNFPYIWHFSTYYAAIFKLFLLLVIVSMMANEYSYKTLKQNLIDGLSKKEFILSKFYMVVVLATISTVFVFLISLVLGLIYSDYNELGIIFSDLEYFIAFFIKLIGFFSFGLFLGILIKRSAFAVAAMLVWAITEGILAKLILPNSDLGTKLKQFLPLEAMENLIKEPGTRLSAVKSIGNQLGLNKTDYSVHFIDIITVIIWTAIFILLSYWILKKRDL